MEIVGVIFVGGLNGISRASKKKMAEKIEWQRGICWHLPTKKKFTSNKIHVHSLNLVREREFHLSAAYQNFSDFRLRLPIGGKRWRWLTAAADLFIEWG